jgi:uncharacterized membrane protein YdjX (TVP38/TMEM64 family)
MRQHLSNRATARGNVRVAIVVIVAALVGAFFYFDLGSFLSLGYLKTVHGEAVAYVADNVLFSMLGFFVFYVLVTALSLPGATIMTLGAGAVFGMSKGMLVVSFASTAGATLAMLISRTLLQDWVQGRFADQLTTVNEGLRKDGAFYLFSLRMVPLFPFFIINLVMGLTRIPAWQFIWVSQVGMLAGTVVFIFAGTQLAAVTSLSDVLSPGLILALSLLGLFPLIARKSMDWLARARS